MAHFASSSWPALYGPIPYLKTTNANSSYWDGSAVAIQSSTLSTTGTIEGTDLLTFTAPLAGLYRLTVQAIPLVQSNAVTSDVVDLTFDHTDEAGNRTGTAIGSQINLKTAAVNRPANYTAMQYHLRCTASSNVAVKAASTASGTKSAGTFKMIAVLERISD